MGRESQRITQLTGIYGAAKMTQVHCIGLPVLVEECLSYLALIQKLLGH